MPDGSIDDRRAHVRQPAQPAANPCFRLPQRKPVRQQQQRKAERHLLEEQRNEEGEEPPGRDPADASADGPFGAKKEQESQEGEKPEADIRQGGNPCYRLNMDGVKSPEQRPGKGGKFIFNQFASQPVDQPRRRAVQQQFSR